MQPRKEKLEEEIDILYLIFIDFTNSTRYCIKEIMCTIDEHNQAYGKDSRTLLDRNCYSSNIANESRLYIIALP